MSPFKPYRELEHTADIRLEIIAISWPRLLQNAVIAITDTIADWTKVRNKTKHALNIEAPSRDELFLSCLKHVHLLFETQNFLTRQIKIESCSPTSIKAQACGETFDPKRHSPKKEIKAVTYHQLEVRRFWWGWRARVILDI
jgi:SHS2 domain-containing protein